METMELREYGRVLKRRWWLIAGFIVIVCTLTAIYSFAYVKPVYQASTKLIVNKSDANLSGIEQLSIGEINANILLINTYKEIIRTTAIMDQVVERYPELQVTSEQLIRRVGVSSVNDSQVMTLSIIDPSYDRAMNIVNAIAEVFKESIPGIMRVDNVTILDEAKPLQNPPAIGANPIFNIVVGFVVSLMLSIGICFLLEYLDDSIKSERDVTEVLALPTLAAISKMTKKDLEHRRNKRMTNQVKEAPYATVNQ